MTTKQDASRIDIATRVAEYRQAYGSLAYAELMATIAEFVERERMYVQRTLVVAP
jgi:hypothetical protein